MKNILIVTGSVRKVNVNSGVVELVKAQVEAREGLEAQVADLGELSLPFYDAGTPPSVEDFVIEHENVQTWSDMVKAADAVVIVAPEYNHSLSAIQKNAIDWLYSEWKDKPVAFVAYGFYAGKHSIDQLNEIGTVTNWRAIGQPVGFQLTQDIDMDGTFLKEDEMRASVEALVEQIAQTV